MKIPTSLAYNGIYRFMDNPDALVGYAGFYGMALICESGTMVALAVFSQIMHYLFVRYVEM